MQILDIIDLVRALARQMPDETIAAVLNRSGKSTGYGNSWTPGGVFAHCVVSMMSPFTVRASALPVAK